MGEVPGGVAVGEEDGLETSEQAVAGGLHLEVVVDLRWYNVPRTEQEERAGGQEEDRNEECLGRADTVIRGTSHA